MKHLSIVMLLIAGIFWTPPILANEKAAKSVKDEQILKTVTLDDALGSGEPVVCLFITSKGCHCTMEKVNSAIALCDTFFFPENTIYLKVNIDNNHEYGKKYKIFALPTILFFDNKGKELGRLQSWEINEKKIDDKFASFYEPVKGKK